MANVAGPESVAADVACGLCRLRMLSGHRASRQRRMLRRSPQSNLRHPGCLCPGAHSTRIRFHVVVAFRWVVRKRCNSLRGIVYLRGTRRPFHRSFSSSGEYGGLISDYGVAACGVRSNRGRAAPLSPVTHQWRCRGSRGVAYCFYRHLRVHPASSRTVASGIGLLVNGYSDVVVFGYVVLPGQETVPFTPQSYCRFSVRQCQALRVLHIFLHTLILRGSKNPS